MCWLKSMEVEDKKFGERFRIILDLPFDNLFYLEFKVLFLLEIVFFPLSLGNSYF